MSFDTHILLIPILSGIIMSVVLLGLFVFQERYKARKERVRYARLIITELSNIHEITSPLTWKRFEIRTNHLVGEIPRNTYDGLVASAMISVFDTNLQIQLHAFYEKVNGRQHDYSRWKCVV